MRHFDRRLTDGYVAECLFGIIAAAVITIFVIMMGQPEPTHVPQAGNECRVSTLPQVHFYVPCSEISPSKYPQLWVDRGQEV